MDIQTIISVMGLIGLGGIVGSYFQNLFNKKREIDLEIRQINEEGYRSTLVWMRVFLKTENLHHFKMDDQKIYSMKNNKEKKDYAKEKVREYFHNLFLSASNGVLKSINLFLQNSNIKNFHRTALAMRKDLWNKN